MTAPGPPPAAASRYPVRHRLDGDFSLAEILSLPAGIPMPGTAAPRPGIAAASLQARLWQPGTLDSTTASVIAADGTSPDTHPAPEYPPAATPADAALLHAFETSPLWTPPVAASTAALVPAAASAWLILAAHWTAVTAATGDLRFLNASCKLLGAAWTHYRDATADLADGSRWRQPPLPQRLATAARLIQAATTDLAGRLSTRLMPADLAGASPDLAWPSPSGTCGGAAPATVVLASAGSASAGRFVSAASSARVPIAAICWYHPPPRVRAGTQSSYASAWYPPGPASLPRDDALSLPVPQVTAPTWDAVVGALRHYRADLVILLGMPVVPAPVLAVARLGFLNAHNGALPCYRGMDAVAWALMNNDPVICTLHIARPRVDAGEILAAIPVPFPPADTLRARVKAAQLMLLLAAAGFAAATGRLPDATRQAPGSGRQYYRLHPHLKRVLDASPYAGSISQARRPEGTS